MIDSSLPYNWIEKTLGEVCTLQRGFDLPKRLRKQGDHPLISSSGHIDVHIEYKVKAPGVTTGRSGSIGNVFYIEDNYWPLNTVLYVKNFHGNYEKFVYYLLQKLNLRKYASGAGVPTLNRNHVHKENISIPKSYQEQKQIVSILDKAFKDINQAIANTERNLANARELFDSYLNNMFSQDNKSWKTYKLGDNTLIQIIDGDRGKNYPRKDDFSSDGYCLFLNTKNVRPNGFNFEQTMFITEAKDKALRKGRLKKRDVVLTTRGTIGNIAIFNNSVKYKNIRINSGMLIFRPNENKLNAEYLFNFFRSNRMKKQVIKNVSGAAQPQLPIKTLVEFDIPIPNDVNQQINITKKIDVFFKKCSQLEVTHQKKLNFLKELKQSLLQKAFTGELTADWRKQQKETAA